MTRIGRYEVELEIGRGAMGTVYLAQDPRLRRRVAVKTFARPRELSPDEEDDLRRRFLREAQAAARLSHPAIVTIYDADEDRDANLPYIAMEYVPGENLKQILESEGRLPVERVLAMVDVLSDALQTAHEGGIVHRDVKPANLVVRESDGATKIADFGVAKLQSSTLTRSGMSIGSPAYMSPEQIQGGPVDGRSDFFSLAVILYEILCGTRPFCGEDLTSLIYAVLHETPVPITRRIDGLPAGLDAFFDRALAKDPADRFPDGRSFREGFENACRQKITPDVEATLHEAPAKLLHSELENPPPSRSRRAAMLAVAALLLFWAGWLIFGDREAHLRLDAKSGIESGELTLLIDGDEVYRRELAAPREKRGFFKKVLDKDLETFEAWIEVTPGKHEVTAHLLPEGMESAYKDVIVVDLEPGETRRIRLAAGRRLGSMLNLKSD